MDITKMSATERMQYENEQTKKRIFEIEIKYPEICTIKDQIRTLTTEYYYKAKLAKLRGEELEQMSEEEFIQKKSVLRVKLNKILDKYNIPHDYDQTKIHCQICNDSGHVKGEPCECEKKRIARLNFEQFFSNSGIPEEKQEQTFENFDFRFYSKEQNVEEMNINQFELVTVIFKSCQKFCQMIESDQKPPNLYIYGDVGQGKSYLSFCVANRLIKNGISVLYRRFDRLIQEIQRTYSKSNVSAADLMETVYSAEVLILDDLGVEKPSVDNAEKLYQIIEERNANGKPTLITSNFSVLELINRYNAAITGKRIGRRIDEKYKTFYIEAMGEIPELKRRLGNNG